MKKRFCIICAALVMTVILCSMAGCSLTSLFSNDPERYYIEIGKVEDSQLASIVANNTIPSCLRVSTEYKRIGITAKGSGFFVTKDGYIITNRHCVVRFSNGSDLPSYNGDKPMDANYVVQSPPDANGENATDYRATLVAYSTSADIALLKIKPTVVDAVTGATKNFTPVTFDAASDLYYGERLYTVGNPEDIGFVLSELMVAAPAIKVNSGDSFSSIILDGNINHGNSGGPLVDAYSHVVGLIFARVENSSNDTYGLGCAIPSKVVTDFLDSNKIEYSSFTPQSGDAA